MKSLFAFPVLLALLAFLVVGANGRGEKPLAMEPVAAASTGAPSSAEADDGTRDRPPAGETPPAAAESAGEEQQTGDGAKPPAAGEPAPVVPLVEPERPPRALPTAPPPPAASPAPARPRPQAPKPRPKPQRLSPEIEAMLLGREPGERRAAKAQPPRRKPPEGLVTVSGIRDRVVYRKGYVGGIPIHVIAANLRHPEVKVGAMVARGGIGHSERFESMLRRARPSAALTGTFFGLRNNLPTGDIIVNRRNLYRGFIGTALAITNGNVVSFITTGYKEAPSWHLFDTVIRTGPRLVEARELVVSPKEEGFRSLERHVPRPRTAVAITARSQLLLVAVKQPISLYRLGLLMQHLGAYHAAALDGGTSTAMSMGGRIVASPGRPLTNLLLIYDGRDRYQRALPHLVPSRRRPGQQADRIRLDAARQAKPPAALPTAPEAQPTPATPTAPPEEAPAPPSHVPADDPPLAGPPAPPAPSDGADDSDEGSAPVEPMPTEEEEAAPVEPAPADEEAAGAESRVE